MPAGGAVVVVAAEIEVRLDHGRDTTCPVWTVAYPHEMWHSWMNHDPMLMNCLRMRQV